MRKPHYWRACKSDNLPTAILAVDTESHAQGVVINGTETHYLTLGVAKYARLEKGNLTRRDCLRFTSPDSFWSFVLSKLSKERTLHVVAHNFAFDMGILGGWVVLSETAWKWHKVILEDGVFFMDGEHNGRRVLFTDTFNYVKTKLANLAFTVGMEKMEMPDTSVETTQLWEYCDNDCEVVLQYYAGLANFVSKHSFGPFGITTASLAFNTFRRKFMQHQILVHDDVAVLKLERRSYYGGVVDTNFLGEVRASPIYELDVTSLYPSCYLNPLPYHLIGSGTSMNIDEFSKLGSDTFVIADCIINCKSGCYPVRTNKGLIYPTGEFQTSLAEPELREALRREELKSIGFFSVYKADKIFADYATTLFALKQKASDEGDIATRDFVKLLLNSLYGKTGQQSKRWREITRQACSELCDVHKKPAGTFDYLIEQPPPIRSFFQPVHDVKNSVTLEFRCLFGIVEVNVGVSESRDSVPAIAAAITSYGRSKLRKLQEIAGKSHYFYSDTDSIWVDGIGKNNLELCGQIGSGVIGLLEVKREVTKLTIHGRKDYEYERSCHLGKITKKVVKGIKNPTTLSSEGKATQTQFPSAMSQLRLCTPYSVRIDSVIKQLRRSVTWCNTTSEGYTRPYHLPCDAIQEVYRSV